MTSHARVATFQLCVQLGHVVDFALCCLVQRLEVANSVGKLAVGVVSRVEQLVCTTAVRRRPKLAHDTRPCTARTFCALVTSLVRLFNVASCAAVLQRATVQPRETTARTLTWCSALDVRFLLLCEHGSQLCE